MVITLVTTALLTQAPDLNGIWEIQSLGSDRAVRIEMQGDQIVVHRVMYPTFEGESYRLDHLYRGTLNGQTIRGKLLVKDDELPDFEVLRGFDGSLKDERLVIDGMPLERVENAEGDEVAMLPIRPRKLKTETKKTKRRFKKHERRRGVESGKTQKTEQAPPTVIAEKEGEAPSGADLYDQIMGGSSSAESMIRVSREIDVPDAGAEALEAGRAAYADGDYAEALESLRRADELGVGGLTHKYLGLTLLKLGRHSKAKAELKKALRLDPTDREVAEGYAEAKASD